MRSTRVGVAAAVLWSSAWGPPPEAEAADAVRWFDEVAAESGLDFEHENGAEGRLLLPEIMGPGVALFDLDGDGDLDVYLVQSGDLVRGSGETVELVPASERRQGDRLYRNETEPGGSLRFDDVTEAIGLRATGYGVGVAVGDVDGDGWEDVYVTNLGPNQLLRNDGGQRLVDVTAEAGVGDPGWGTSATFLDFDRDGHLDLYVVNYVEWRAESTPNCYAESSRRDYCGPQAYPRAADRLYRNRGDGSFEPSHEGPLRDAAGAGLGAVAADFDGDGWSDLFVANDGMENRLWLNRGGRFQEEALLRGAAVNGDGLPEASMGVDVADFDADGDPDLYMTHLDGETDTLLVNDGTGHFADRTRRAGLGAAGFALTAFGTGWRDFDGDGLLDLLVVNGAVKLEAASGRGGGAGLGQPNLLFRNFGPQAPSGIPVYGEIGTAAAPPIFREPEVSRGAAFGDLDRDGDVDVVYANNAGPARLLENRSGARLLTVRALEAAAEGRLRPALGARIERRAGGAREVAWVRADGSFASASDPAVHFRRSAAAGSEELVVQWADGGRERFSARAPSSRELPSPPIVLRRGAGEKEMEMEEPR